MGDINRGWFNFVNPIEWFGSTFDNFDRGEFGFVPLFSSVAYTGPRNTQNDIERSLADIQNNNWTPFDAVFADNDNSEHVRPQDIQGQWNNLFATELGIPITTACQVTASTATPPTGPIFAPDRTQSCPTELVFFDVANTSTINGLHTYTWQVSGGSGAPRNGTGASFAFQPFSPGVYTVTVNKSFAGNAGTRASSQTITVLSNSSNQCGGGAPPLGSRTQSILNKSVGEDTTHTVVSGFKLWPNPTAQQLHMAYRTMRTGEVSISLTSAVNPQQSKTVLSTSYRPPGTYEETYYVDHLSPGLYIVSVRTSEELVQKKLFIKR